MLWGFSRSFQNSNRRPTGEVIAKNVKIRLRRSVLNYFSGRIRADGCKHRHHNHHFHFLPRSAFYGYLILHMAVRRETQKRQWEKGLIILFVPNYGEEMCVDPGKGNATLGVGGPGPQQGTVRVSWAQTGEEGRRSKMTEDIEDGSFMASRDIMHRVSAMCFIISSMMYIMYQKVSCLTVFLFQENKSFSVSYHLHSSSDVREAVSRTLLSPHLNSCPPRVFSFRRKYNFKGTWHFNKPIQHKCSRLTVDTVGTKSLECTKSLEWAGKNTHKRQKRIFLLSFIGYWKTIALLLGTSLEKLKKFKAFFSIKCWKKLLLFLKVY